MKRPSFSIPGSLLLLALLPGGRAAFGQSYGDHDQVLTIGGAALPVDENMIGADGYLLDVSFDGEPAALVPLALPDGALVGQLCLDANDTDNSQPTTVSIVAVKLVPGGGGDPFVLTVPGSVVTSTANAGYASYCSGPIDDTVRSTMDVDGDGAPDSVARYLRVAMGHRSAIGAVRITWKRQVSPPPDVPTFADVPASDVAWTYIEALNASGITAGCGGGNYCPDATLTRRQMAVFLAKALGLHWTD